MTREEFEFDCRLRADWLSLLRRLQDIGDAPRAAHALQMAAALIEGAAFDLARGSACNEISGLILQAAALERLAVRLGCSDPSARPI